MWINLLGIADEIPLSGLVLSVLCTNRTVNVKHFSANEHLASPSQCVPNSWFCMWKNMPRKTNRDVYTGRVTSNGWWSDLQFHQACRATVTYQIVAAVIFLWKR